MAQITSKMNRPSDPRLQHHKIVLNLNLITRSDGVVVYEGGAYDKSGTIFGKDLFVRFLLVNQLTNKEIFDMWLFIRGINVFPIFEIINKELMLPILNVTLLQRFSLSELSTNPFLSKLKGNRKVYKDQIQKYLTEKNIPTLSSILIANKLNNDEDYVLYVANQFV